MAKLDFERFLLDLVGIIDGNCLSDDEVTTGAIRGALKMQGLKISKKGDLIGIDVEEPDCKMYLVYNREQDKFHEVNEEPPLANTYDHFMKLGGYGLSEKAKNWLKNHFVAEEDVYGLARHSTLLVQCVETLGEEADDECSCLKVKELKGNKYIIREYDGWESVIEPDDIEWITIT